MKIRGTDKRLVPLQGEEIGRSIAHARYMGSGQTFDDAIREFAVNYPDQTISDHKAFAKAIREGRIQAITEQ